MPNETTYNGRTRAQLVAALGENSADNYISFFPEGGDQAATDAERLDWLDADLIRLEDVYHRTQNECEDVRAAIDVLMRMS